MSRPGWIKIHRSILDHWLFSDVRELSRQEAWIRMLLLVNYQQKRELIKGQIYTCEPGQSLMSLDSWAREFNWSIQKVRTFFKTLEKDAMIETEGLQYTTRLTICNWATYQLDATDQQQTANRPLTDEQQTANTPLTTTKEGKKEKKEIRKEDSMSEGDAPDVRAYQKLLLSKIDPAAFDLNPDYLNITKGFQMLFRDNLAEAGSPTKAIDDAKGKWYDHISAMIDKDKITKDQLREMYLFLKSDAFWKKNIRSTEKLRLQKEALLLAIKEQKDKVAKLSGSQIQNVNWNVNQVDADF